ncbi:MAG TPA: M1 family metallopeptidase [Herpetosiphonaceae bacterium]|nr:M1 family metallopeptidase [Herpetosiphonaceae bacterium]
MAQLRLVLLLLAVAALGTPARSAVYAAEPAQATPSEAPRYELDIDVDTRAGRLTGQMTLDYTNRTGTTLRDIVLRMYANFLRDIFGDGGDVRMDVMNVRVNGTGVKVTLEAGSTAVRVPLPAPLAPGGEARVELSWSTTIRPWQRSDGSFPLPSSYPMLAAWTGAWRTDVSRFPDRVFATAATYRATIAVPEGMSVIAGGTTTSTRTADGKAIFEVTTGPVREFAFSVGRFAVERATHADIGVNVYHKPGDGLDAAARLIALHAAASLAVFGDRFGAYPYGELDFHLINARRGFDIGAEFPGLIVILVNGKHTAETRFVTAHEVAHQWWYGVVGNDIFREPWIDEAFAQWSALLVEEHFAGAAAAERVYQQQVVRLAQRTKAGCGLPINAYGSWNAYYAAVYGRGAQFLYTLRRELGDRAFFAGLRQYYADNTFGIGTTAEVRAALEQSSRRDLAAMFRTWTGQ